MGQGLGQARNALLPVPEEVASQLDPRTIEALRRQAVLQAGLGMMSAGEKGQGLGTGALYGLDQAQQGLGQGLNQAWLGSRARREDQRVQRQDEWQSLAMARALAQDERQAARDELQAAQEGGLKIGSFSPGDYTPQSLAKFQQSGNPADLVRYQAPQQPQRESMAVTAVMGPDGKTPVYVRTADAVGRSPVSGINNTAADISGDGLDLAAETYRSTGKLPTGLSRVPGMATKIINRAAEIADSVGDTPKATLLRQQAFKAQQASLSKVSQQKAMVGAFERTAQKNIDLVLEMSAKTDRTGSPLVNKALIDWRQNVTGDPDTASFVNALTAARTEYAKVLSGATGAQGITDSARKEANDLFNTATSDRTLQAVMQTAKREMANRMTAFDEEIAATSGALDSKTPEQLLATPGPTPPPPQPAPASAVEHLRKNPGLKAAFQAKYGYLPDGL